jgi:hypothetical protein
MGADYIPEQDLKAAVWMKLFARRLVENPQLYRTSAEDAAEIDQRVRAFRTAHAIANAPVTRTIVNVSIKNSTRREAEKWIRPEAQRIRTDPRIRSSDKLAIGLKVYPKRRRHVGPPKSEPILNIDAHIRGVLKITVMDSATLGRARPRSAIGMQLYQRLRPRSVAEASTDSNSVNLPENGEAEQYPWRYIGLITKTPHVMHPEIQEAGDEVTLIGRWMNRRGEVGHFGPEARIQVPFPPGLRMPNIVGNVPKFVA